MLRYGIQFSTPSFWMGGGLESRCVDGMYGADGVVARHHPHRTYHLRNLVPTYQNTPEDDNIHIA